MPHPARRRSRPRTTAENPLARAKRFLATHVEDVLAGIAEGLVLLDLEGKVAFLSPGAEDMTGVSVAHAAGRPATHVFAAHPWLAATATQLTGGTTRRSEDGDLITLLGRRTSVRLTVAPILDADGAPVGTVLLLRDLAAQLAEHAERGARSAELAAVAAGLAHEIKNPLGGIKGASQLLAESLGADPDALRMTSLITREVDRVSALLEQLLELTRPPKLRCGAVNVHRVIQEVVLLEVGAEAGGRVRYEFDPSLPEVWVDDDKIRQVVLNLVKNAWEAVDGTGTVTITTRIETDFHVRNPGHGRGRQFVSVDVEDTGPGIQPEDLARVFTPFFTTKSRGTGLGLAVSQRIVTQHGGLIRVESEPGRGTRVRVSLPVAASAGGA